MSTTQISQITSEEKRGGPYTKQEQEKRRDKVYELHFEKGHSAVQIAQMLDVNRNTVNNDIQFLYAKMASQINGKNVGGMLLKQIERLDTQRKRLYDELEKQTDFPSRIVLEKIVLDIDNKIASFVSRMIGKDLRFDKYATTEEISEDELCEIVRYLIFNAGHLYSENASEDTILLDTIKMKKCDVQYARNVLNTMKRLGLELCKSLESSHYSYDLLLFALLRGYVTKDELKAYLKKREDKEIQEEKTQKEVEEKYEKKYGKDTNKWPDGVEDTMEEELFPGSLAEYRYGL